MKTQAKIDLASDITRLCLHKEGIFYKLYNRQAMLFVENVKPLKVKAKFVKTVNAMVYSCGFPASIIEAVKGRLRDMGGNFEECPEMLTVVGVTWPAEGDYAQWCGRQQEVAVQKQGSKTSGSFDLAHEIAGFQVMRSTPMDAMNFLIELQAKLAAADE
jgi:hypothetical protein